MKEQIGILGVGQCGGNVASLFEHMRDYLFVEIVEEV